MMNDRNDTTSGKAPFEPPRLTVIDLAAQEVLANACKLNTRSTLPDTFICTITACSSYGS